MRIIWITLFIFLMLCFSAQALPLQQFASLPILHEGRVKPMESFARIYFDNAPVKTLVTALFKPDEAKEKLLFTIDSKQLRNVLQLDEAQKVFSYNTLAPRFDAIRPAIEVLANKDSAKFSANEKALWVVYQSLLDFAQLTRSFSWAELVEDSNQDYLELRSERESLLEKTKKTILMKGDNIDLYTNSENQIAKRSLALTSLYLLGKKNDLFKVVSVTDSEYASPWQIIEGGKGTPKAGSALQHWKSLMNAYQANDLTAWNQHLNLIDESNPSASWKLNLERFYYQAQLITVTTLAYGLVLLLWLISLYKQHYVRFIPAIFGGAISLNGLIIAIRMVLLERPPVSTLYESILFVAFVSAICCLIISLKSRYKEALPIGALLGFGLLSASGAYAEQGDTMGVLIAVLNTNIWLATHVVCITLGYGISLVAGSVAHVALRKPKLDKLLAPLAVFALLLTTVGTILGGIWADQSWGRFWGWDPKENGALLIVLWLAWVLHGRLTPCLKPRIFTAFLACTNIIVALSWFGVNLLNTGLHSYGFTDSAAIALFAFCGLELLIISVLLFYPLKSNKLHK